MTPPVALRTFVARASDRRLERTLGSGVGLRLLFGALARGFPPEHRTEFAGALRCELHRADGGLRTWTIAIAPDGVRAHPGVGAPPRLTVKLSLADFLRVVVGELDAGTALLDGRMDLAGDARLALRLGELFD